MANFNISVYNGNTCIDTLNIGAAKSRYKDDDFSILKFQNQINMAFNT